jgi:hypothetical protein
VSGDWTNGITIELMSRRLTPRQAAKVKYRAMIFRDMDPDPRIDALIDGDPGHRWFCFCLDAVARQETP